MKIKIKFLSIIPLLLFFFIVLYIHDTVTLNINIKSKNLELLCSEIIANTKQIELNYNTLFMENKKITDLEKRLKDSIHNQEKLLDDFLSIIQSYRKYWKFSRDIDTITSTWTKMENELTIAIGYLDRYIQSETGKESLKALRASHRKTLEDIYFDPDTNTRDLHHLILLKSALFGSYQHNIFENDLRFYNKVYIAGMKKVTRSIQHEIAFDLRRVKVVNTLIYVFIVLTTTLYVILFSNNISKRIYKVEDSAKRLSEKDLTKAVEFKSNDEIGSLGRYINKIIMILKHEIHEHKVLEEQIKDINKDLEIRVSQRTMELEAANHELKDFAYIVSHDLKAPLRAITQLAHWISEDYSDAFDEAGKEQLELLINRAKRMNNLIDGILKYSRVGRIDYMEEKVDLNALVKDIITMLHIPAHISINFDHELPILRTDRTRIEQIFQNLISNAVKYMDKAEGMITIGCTQKESEYEFHITDNGPGIDPKYHDKIFQIFQTLTARDKKESTGIGLSIVQKCIKILGGTIRVESKEKSGTTFYFTIKKG